VSATNIWLKMTGIEGEAQDFGHEGEIEVMSWSLQKIKTQRTAKGKATAVEHLHFIHQVDLASAILASHMTANKVADKAVLSVRNPSAQARIGGGFGKMLPPIDFFRITLTNVMVMKMTTIGFAGGCYEEVELSFDSITKEYEKMKNGISGGVATAVYRLGEA
jgi:type VI secretion system secreted protein Hcp